MPTTLLCLHGWGGSQESFTELRAALAGTPDISILTPDLPGFGAAPEPPKPWTTDDYADWVTRLIAQEHPTRLFIVGHSHGGRIALKLAARHDIPIDRLFLCAAAGIRHPRHLKRMIGLVLAKCGKTLLMIPGLRSLAPIGRKFLYKLVRVHDYEKASPLMQQTLINVSREDLRGILKDVTVPTEIFWGEDDGLTPVGDGKLMAAAIPGAKLRIFPGVRHAVHRDRAEDIAREIRAAL